MVAATRVVAGVRSDGHCGPAATGRRVPGYAKNSRHVRDCWMSSRNGFELAVIWTNREEGSKVCDITMELTSNLNRQIRPFGVLC